MGFGRGDLSSVLSRTLQHWFPGSTSEAGRGALNRVSQQGFSLPPII